MTAQVTGIGIGSFILFSVWLVTIILFIISLRTQKIIGIIAILTAATVTLILILLPVGSKDFVSVQEQKESDYQFVWRNILAAFLGLCSIGSIAIFFTNHCTEPLNSVPVRTWILD